MKPATEPPQAVSILIVDATYIVALDLADELTARFAASITIATTTADFTKALASALVGTANTAPFDLAILDVELDGQCTTPLVRRLIAAGVPIIFASAHEPSALLSTLYGQFAYIRKPYDFNSLGAAVRETIAHHSGSPINPAPTLTGSRKD